MHKYIKAVHSPEQDENVLDQSPVLDLNNVSLSGALADREGYDPVPQNITQNPGHIHIPNMVQDVKIGETVIRGPVIGVSLRQGQIGNILGILDIAINQNQSISVTGYGQPPSPISQILLGSNSYLFLEK